MSKKKSASDEKLQNELKKSGEIPKHIAIIMDGNGRWAKKRGLPRVAGHKRGVDTVKDIVEACAEIGVKYLTLYTFSTENWKRPKEEVSTLMRLLLNSLRDRVDELCENDIRLTTIGDTDSLPYEVQKQLKADIERTKNNKKMILNLALSYSGRWEIIEAVKKISRAVEKGDLKPDEINEQLFSKFLTTKDLPDPDLVIRTSGEFRVSNFLLWQIAYSEFVITDIYWPDFNRHHLYESIRAFQKRERRFGKVSEQIKKEVNSKGVTNAEKLPSQIS
ncbi:Undecaprenyl pyrophosphate synthase [Ignavibacterium album JCM 16511]|uniref:Isoprenyl transferase n=1 Tax=Ignavibacterium album (strain DSM 19864 / JCM 16511 / NBRC 101810 / Mat9-16) TaxID=945713 RepID=I0AGV1_IGNAJ|nr:MULTISPECIES: isoprenyl transferase [Ignavibacterium]AFH48208.1 Undecaprenyl pyrophosphate synthase [Ignavibacterium album JCM 16511]BDQ03973.1 MAG: isoprenyl transferase [Ignavibacterium sp.]